MKLNLITNSYDRQARLYPALILVAPIVVTVIAIMLTHITILRSIGTLIIGCGGAFLLSQLARDAGKKGEKQLFVKWGGLPSVAIFRHRDTRLDSITKARYHKKMAALVKETKVPSAENEQTAPVAADQIYTAWSTYLRANTRNTKKYTLLFQELVNYGYRRNLWGMRSIGIIISGLSCAVSVLWIYLQYQTTGAVSNEIIVALIFAIVFFNLWIFQFTEDWVYVPAYAYAERLVETIETFVVKPKKPKTDNSKIRKITS